MHSFFCWTGTSLGKKEKRVDEWSLTQKHLSASQNKEWKDRLVRKSHDFGRFKRFKNWLFTFLFCLLIVITGSHKAAVSSAITRVELLVESFRKKQPFTHFLSFPLNDPRVQEGFLRFKDEVLQQCSQVLQRKDCWKSALSHHHCINHMFVICRYLMCRAMEWRKASFRTLQNFTWLLAPWLC